MPASGSPSTPAAQLEVAPLPDSVEWVQLRDGNAGKAYFWNRRTRATVWKARAGVEVVWYGTRDGTGIRVSVRMTSLLFLLGEGRHRQPREVYKYWAPCRLCCVEIFFTVNNGHWFCHPCGTLLVLEAITLVQLIPAHGCMRTFVRSGLRSIPSPSLVVMVSQMS